MENNIEIEQKLNILFLKLGFNLYTKGTLYLKRAVILAFENNNLLYNYDNLLNLIRLSFNISSHSINTAISYSINTMFAYYGEEKLENIFGDLYDYRKPSSKYFISLCVEWLKL